MLILILKLSCIWRIRSILQFHFLRDTAYCHYWKIKLFLNAYYPNFNFSGHITPKHHSSPFPITTNLIQYFNTLALVCHWKITKTSLFTLNDVSLTCSLHSALSQEDLVHDSAIPCRRFHKWCNRNLGYELRPSLETNAVHFHGSSSSWEPQPQLYAKHAQVSSVSVVSSTSLQEKGSAKVSMWQ